MGFEFTAPVKDPDAILRHAVDWTAWLQDGETIIAQAVTAPVGITVDQVTQADGVVSYRIAGGADGAEYIVTCRVTTSLGRIDDRSVRYRVGQR
jgi:NADPH-dependent curcumin reductase CurA